MVVGYIVGRLVETSAFAGGCKSVSKRNFDSISVYATGHTEYRSVLWIV